jgi:hypothetical protein
MTKKAKTIVVVVFILFVIIAIGMRRASMMSGSSLELTAVSADGAPLPPSAETTSITGKLPKNAVAQKSGDMIVSIALNPYPPKSGLLSDFDVTLADSKGKAINDASIFLDLTMPQMWMPQNQLAMEFVSDGKYHAAGLFTMRGWWRIEALITRGGVIQSFFFDVGL